jgi:hypothetical protein
MRRKGYTPQDLRKLPLLRVNFVEGGLDALSDRFRATNRPEVHEQQAWLLGEDMAVECRDFDVMIFQCGDDRIYFVRCHHEVSGGGYLAGTGLLKVDRFSHALGALESSRPL